MKAELEELYKHRELLYMIAYRDIKVRYKQSIMGFLWAILMPILIVFSGILVRYASAMMAHTHLKTTDIATSLLSPSHGRLSFPVFALRAAVSRAIIIWL